MLYTGQTQDFLGELLSTPNLVYLRQYSKLKACSKIDLQSSTQQLYMSTSISVTLYIALEITRSYADGQREKPHLNWGSCQTCTVTCFRHRVLNYVLAIHIITRFFRQKTNFIIYFVCLLYNTEKKKKLILAFKLQCDVV